MDKTENPTSRKKTLPFTPTAYCKCTEVMGHLEEIQELLMPRNYKPSPGCLAAGDWTENHFLWDKHIESIDGLLEEDKFLLSTDSKYWSIHDVQRYFVGDLHCEKVLFTYQYPNPKLPTKLGQLFWNSNNALKRHNNTYAKTLHMSLEVTLKKIEANQSQVHRIIISDQLIKLNLLDYFRRKTFMRILLNILRCNENGNHHFPKDELLRELWEKASKIRNFKASTNSICRDHFLESDYQGNPVLQQENLQLVSFENLSATRIEGVRLIQQLACFNAHSLRYLFLWRFVLTNENPLLINYSYITGTGQHIPRPKTKHCFTRSLGALKNLEVLALEYSHIADGTGAALLSLLPIMNKPHFRLQLVCREDQIPTHTDAALGVGGYKIPDSAWRRVTVCCPDLYLLLAFVRVRHYDDIIRFLSLCMPLTELHYEMGIDLNPTQRQDSDISCVIRLLAHRYANTLGTLSIHQWRFAVFPLQTVLKLLPGLVCFCFIGLVDEIDLRHMFKFVACGVCLKLKKLKIQIQSEESKDKFWKNNVKNLNEEYSDIMKLYDIDFCLSIYKS